MLFYSSRQYNGAIQLLSVGIQCASCGLRFVPEQKDKYREHLDWHFRQNKRGKDQMNMPKHRDWYYTVTVSMMHIQSTISCIPVPSTIAVLARD